MGMKKGPIYEFRLQLKSVILIPRIRLDGKT